jgi:ribosomal protein L3 glutamine methyltransferase
MTKRDERDRTEALEQLHTVRDWFRFAVSRFTAAGLVYGHGTQSALDEAAFLILHSLNLPIDQLDPWLDARLLAGEREKLFAIIAARIETRRPAAYLTNAAYIQGHRFYVDQRVIVPRSFIGELLAGGQLARILRAPEGTARVLDLCTGSGCLAILSALAFPEATVDATDISLHALEVAHRNVADYGLEDRIELLEGDLFKPVAGRRYDLILANPPYVAAAAVATFPPEYAAEPAVAHLGGEDGLDIVRRILRDAAGHLTEQGALVVEVGTGRPILEAQYPDLPFLWLDTAESSGEVFLLEADQLSAGVEPMTARS